MEDFDRISVLSQKIITIKEHLTAFEEFLAQFNSHDPAQIAELQLRYNSVFSYFSNIDELYNEIQLIDSETDHTLDKKTLQNSFFKLLASAQNHVTIITQREQTNSLHNHELNSNSENERLSNVSSHCRKLKLPQATLPTFSGKVEEWLSFKDTFITMIHRRDDITNVEKLQYLKSVLKDEALRKIQVFAITDENYDRAWKLLQKSYEDKRTLISRHLNLLLRLPSQEKESYQGLIALADESQQHLQSLASLGVHVTHEIVVAIIEEKLHKLTLEKWDESIKNGEFPSLEDMTDFLYRTAARISKRKMNTDNNDKDSPVNKKRKIESKKQALVTSTSKQCILCSDSHPLFKCTKFLSLTVNERFKTVKDANLCVNCLRNHKTKDCKFGTCKKCNKRHNTLLHFTRSQDQNQSENKET
ncbi:uncharacterized protein LOC122507066 [Leptopilina heterotoma]|uniref:uncharacterized protein LOC122507066 n=1 Tax=Leptopilina heterotoma TaxID=63436 RepID=UPI001CAA361B|nr:uncharacterized protein LOC122507066 [Leptopilina heterotoma]